ncbi:MAG TPA: PLP-dependent transferase [Pararhizobium sp.]|nr:PLP-dependent transferase [Pararhizobium sp.]
MNEPDASDPMIAATLALAHDESEDYAPVVPPIVQTSLFTFPSYAAMERNYTDPKPRPTYSRVGNPTVRAFEEKMIALEQGEDAIGFASGMAAISSSVLAFVSPGDRVVCVRHVYPDAYRLFETFLKRMNISVDYVDGNDLGAVEQAPRGARLFYMESPTSWMMQAHDVGALARLARAAGAVSVIDNSWASPVFQKPLTLGCDIVVHSASKYIGGHSDTVAGVAVGSREAIGAVRSRICPYLGGKLAPLDGWLLLRGLRTLPIRMQAIESAALSVARKLAEHPAVAAVHHPRLAGALPDGLTGTSGLFSVEFDGGISIRHFIDALKLFKLGVSWGGHESLAMPAKLARTQANGPNSVIDFDVPEQVVRLNIGLEGPEALWRDLLHAIESGKKGGD